MSVKLELNIASKLWKEFNPRPIIEEALAEIAKHVDIEGCEVSVMLADDEALRALNRDYRAKDKPTNVLSFPQDDEVMLGDIALAFETLKREAEEQDKTFHDHFVHLFVHGMLHLLGYDHEEHDDQKEMEQQEIDILHNLAISDPYN
jgi:probable rRNA maturation factor